MTTSRTDRQQEPGVVDHSNGRLRRAVTMLRELGPAEIIRRMRKSGVRGTFDFVQRNIRHQIAHHYAKQFDRREGVDTAGSIQLGQLDIVGPNGALGNEAVSTSPSSFQWLIRRAPLPSNATFIDIGCGKGRTVLLASRVFPRAIGVEFAAELVAIAERNLSAFAAKGGQMGPASLVHMDAAAFEFPPEPLVVYFYNPFSRELFDEVIGNLSHSLEKHPRPCTVIYTTGMSTLDWAVTTMLDAGPFSILERGQTPQFLDAIRRMEYAIFSNTGQTGS